MYGIGVMTLFLGFYPHMHLHLLQHLWILADLQLIIIYLWLAPPSVICLTYWSDFYLIPEVNFDEVHNYVGLPQPHSVMYPQVPPCYSPAYETWQPCWSCILGPYFCTELFHWLSLSVMNRYLVGSKPMVTQHKNLLIMSWGQWFTGTHPLPSITGVVYTSLLPYLMTMTMHTVITYFQSLWYHLP